MRVITIISLVAWSFTISAQSNRSETTLVGVFQGDPIFIKNPYNISLKAFCVDEIFVNNKKVEFNNRYSAIKVDFSGIDLFTPVNIKVISSDSICKPSIINPDAIKFHSAFKYLTVQISDSALYWKTEGEREVGKYTVEKLETGIWREIHEENAKSSFEVAEYLLRPKLIEGINKYRIRYDFSNGRYLYSNEVEYPFYLDPVKFDPKTTNYLLNLSRSAYYEVFNSKSELVLSGTGKTVDVRYLRPGQYVIYFDEKQPATFRRDTRPPPLN